MSCRKECGGCTCFKSAPCKHCVEDHNNVDGHPECPDCGEILYDASELDMLRHKVECFELK